jgi:hypothetical protein
MRIVLAHGVDESALWAFSHLRARSRDRVELVLADALDTATTTWTHWVDADPARVQVRSDTGVVLRSLRAGAVLNRLMWPANELAMVASPTDAAYAASEMRAFAMSWVRSLAPIVVNAPTAQGLSGRWRTPLHWRVLGARAGLAVAPLHMSNHQPDDNDHGGGASTTILAVGGDVLHPSVPPAVRCGIRRLTTLSATTILGVRFAGTDPAAAGWQLLDATPHPDLRIGSEAGVAALERVLTP